MNNSEAAEIVNNRLRPRIRVINYSDKENRGVKDKIINKRPTLCVSREPLLDVRSNNRRCKSASDEIEKGYLRNLKPITVTPPKTRKQKRVSFAVYCKNDSQNRKITKSATPHPGNIPEWHSDGEDVFIEDAEDFGKTVIGYLWAKRKKAVSPFSANVYTTTDTLILIESPEKHVKRPSIKRTLSHRMPSGRKKSKRDSLRDYLDLDSEYLELIITYYRSKEQKYVKNKNFLNKYNPNVENRSAVVHWLQKFRNIFSLRCSAVLAAVRLFDHILASFTIPTNVYLLVAVCTLWIVSKTDSKIIIGASKIARLCGNAYTIRQILRMEQKILTILDYDINLPDPAEYISYYVSFLNETAIDVKGVRLCVAYILECYSLNEDFSTVSISTMTVAATHLALITLYPLCDGWNKNMFRHSLTECTTAKLQTAMLQTIYEIQKPESKFHALYKKYACVENHCVSTFFLKAVGVV